MFGEQIKYTRNNRNLSSGVPHSASPIMSRTDLSKAFLLMTFSSTSSRTSSFRCLICSKIAFFHNKTLIFYFTTHANFNYLLLSSCAYLKAASFPKAEGES